MIDFSNNDGGVDLKPRLRHLRLNTDMSKKESSLQYGFMTPISANHEDSTRARPDQELHHFQASSQSTPLTNSNSMAAFPEPAAHQSLALPTPSEPCLFKYPQWMHEPSHVTWQPYNPHFHDTQKLMATNDSFSPSTTTAFVTMPEIYHGDPRRQVQSAVWSPDVFGPFETYGHIPFPYSCHSLPDESNQSWALPGRMVSPSSINGSTATVDSLGSTPLTYNYLSSDTTEYGAVTGGAFDLASPKCEIGSRFALSEDSNRPGSNTECIESIERSSTQPRLSVVSASAIDSAEQSRNGSIESWPKLERRRPSGKRRVRSIDGQTYTSTTNIEVHVEGARTASKMHSCDRKVGNSRCGKAFERVEHLRRHERTHQGEKRIKCPLPSKFNCKKRLDRRDNWRDHLKTHLKKSNAGRNERCNREEMFEALREHETPEEAKKTISVLEKWMASGRDVVSGGNALRSRR